MPRSTTKRPARRQRPAPAARQAAAQAAVFTSARDSLRALRLQLLAGECPATVTEGERRAAVVDLERALGQMGNLRRHYGRGGR